MSSGNGSKSIKHPSSALVIVSHQSLVRRGSLQLRRIGSRLRAERNFIAIYDVNIAGKGGLENLARKIDKSGIRSVLVLPFFLHDGYHVRVELPSRLRTLRRTHPRLKLRLLPHLGSHPDLGDLVRDIIMSPGRPTATSRAE
ncbi:CbiX/SirB N-terminal domain-containing protein [bacterium]|nr:CbiX/SirB N-terminal domain-containing protein [bacterium]